MRENFVDSSLNAGMNPLKKNHLTAKPTLASHIVSKQRDRELESIFVKLQILEETNRKIQKEVKRYMEGIICLNKTEHKLTTDLSNSSLCHQDTALREVVEEYLTVTCQVGESVQEVTKVCQKAILDPLKRYGGEFSGLAVVLQKREQALQEYNRQDARLRKAEEKEKTAANVLKREQAKKAVQQAKDETCMIHDKLLSELPQFYGLRSEYFTPCLQALIRAQVDYHGTTLRLFTHLTALSTSKPTASQGLPEPESQFQARLQTRLASLQSLNIVRHPTAHTPNPNIASSS